MTEIPRVTTEQVSACQSDPRQRPVAGSARCWSGPPPPGTAAPEPASPGMAAPEPASPGTSAPEPVCDGSYARLDVLIETIAEILNSPVALYCHLDGPGQPPQVVCSWGLGALHDQLARPPRGGLVGRALRAQRAVLEPLHPDHEPALVRAAGDPPPEYALIAPTRPAAGAAAALVAVFSTRPSDEALTLWTAEACAAMLALGAHRPETLNPLLQAGRLDALTGCLNYAGTRRALEKEINRSTRGELNLSLGFIDLDGFKRINDHHGHLRGNAVLREVSQVLRESVRSCDTVGRFGGDEFIVILPDTDERDATRLVARLRSRIAAASIPAVGGPLTASAGVAAWIPGATADELLARADEALLRAKPATQRRAGPRSARGSGSSAAVH